MKHFKFSMAVISLVTFASLTSHATNDKCSKVAVKAAKILFNGAFKSLHATVINKGAALDTGIVTSAEKYVVKFKNIENIDDIDDASSVNVFIDRNNGNCSIVAIVWSEYTVK